MKILLMSQWFPPEPATLLLELAQQLQEFGHEIEVLTGFPNYPYGKLYKGYKLRPWYREMMGNVPITRVFLYPDHSQSGIRRSLNYISFALSALFLGPFLFRRPDAILVYHPPLTIGLPAVLLSKLWRVPMVYRVADMWPETLRATGMISNTAVLDAIGWVAKLIYCHSTAISVISPGFRENLIEKGVPPEKIHVVSNWVDEDTYYMAEPDPQLASKLGLADRYNIMFAGNRGKAQNLETVLEAAVLTQDLKELQYVFVGSGVELENLRDIAHRRNITNVRFLGRYPAEEMPGLYAHADILLVHLKDDPLFRITIPSKIFGYMASGKPILVAVRGDAADLVVDSGAGVYCVPENPVALAEQVRKLVALEEERYEEMAESALSAARGQYSCREQVGQIDQLLVSIT